MEAGDVWLAWAVNAMHRLMLGGEVCHPRHGGWRNLLGLIPLRCTSPRLLLSAGAKRLLPKERLRGVLLGAAHSRELAPLSELLCKCRSQMGAAGLGRKRCSPGTWGRLRQPAVLFPAFVPGRGRCSKRFSPQVPLAFEPRGACLARTALLCLHWHLHCTLHVAAKPSSSCCQAVSLPRNSRVRLLGAFLLGTAFLGQKASHFVPFGGMANGQRLEKALRPPPRLLGRSAASRLVWKLLGATQSRVGMGFSIGVRRGVQDVAAA